MKPPAWLVIVAALVAILVVGFWFVRGLMRRFADASYPAATAMPPVVPESIEEVLARLEAALEKHAPQTLATLQPGLSDEQIRQLETKGGFQLSPEMRALYKWRNGTSADSRLDFIPGHRFASLERIIEERAAQAAQLQEATAVQRATYSAVAGHRATWLDVLPDGAGDGYFFDPARSPDQGAVFYHFTETGSYVFFPSVKNLLAGFAECYESGAYVADAKGVLTEKYEASFAIRGKYGKIVEP